MIKEGWPTFQTTVELAHFIKVCNMYKYCVAGRVYLQYLATGRSSSGTPDQLGTAPEYTTALHKREWVSTAA